MSCRAFIFLLLIGFCAGISEAQIPARKPLPRVLLLYSNDRLLPASLRFDEGFRESLSHRFGDQFELYGEFLDAVRFPGKERLEAMASTLRVRYKERPPDVVVAGGVEALNFLQDRRETLFPGIPLLFGAVRQRDELKVRSGTTGIPASEEITPTLETILRIRPKTREVFVVSGSAHTDRNWDALARVEFRPFEKQVKLTYWNELPFAELLQRASALPSNAAVIFLTYFQEPDGTLLPSSALAVERLAGKCGAPIFGPYDTYIGRGVVGGLMTDFKGEGAAVGRLVERVLAGEPVAAIGVQPPSPGRFQFDDRQLERWKISRSSLPPGSELHFASKSLWEEHPRAVISVVTAIVVQASLITALVLHRQQRRRAEAVLRESEQRMNLAMEAAQFGIWIRDLKSGEVWATPKWRELFGFAPDEALSLERVLARMHPQDESRAAAVLATARDQCGSYEMDFRITLPEGETRWIASMGRYAGDAQGQAVRSMGVSRDVTERKRTAAALAESERNLAHATRLALVGELTASIAHEINQPLGAILSNADAAEMLLDTGSHDELRQILADIRKDDLRASEVIQHVRSLVGKRVPNFAPLDMNETVEMALKMAASEAHRRGVALQADLAKDLPFVEGERVQIEQVLLNLILNGLDALHDTAPDDRRITVRTRGNGASVEITVIDAGHGIPENELPRIFESFFTTKEMGMGLGLAMVRSIVEAHRGSITAENNPAGGATFRLRLPGNGRHTG